MHSVTDLDGEWDAVVAGAGPAGLVAAIACGRYGLRTLLIEQQSALGGMAASGLGLLGFFDNCGNRIIGGVPWEIVTALMKDNAAVVRAWRGATDGDWYEARNVRVDPEKFKRVATEMLDSAGVDLLVHTMVVDSEQSGASIDRIAIQNKSGRQMVGAKRFIDCTGDGDLAARAGARYEIGRRGDGVTQPMTLMFALVNVDLDATIENNIGTLGPWDVIDPPGAKMHSRSVQLDLSPWADRMAALLPQTDGGVTRMWVHDDGDGLYHTGNFAHIGMLDGSSGEQLSAGETAGRKFVWDYVDFLREHVPGFSHAQLANTATHIGVRETRRFRGRYWLTYDEAAAGRQFPDSIGQAGYIFDIHSPVKGTFERLRGSIQIKDKRSYGLPYGMLVPEGIGNLLIAGRCVSGDREAQSSFRVMGTCMVMGHAAGVATAMSISEDIPPGDVDATSLRTALRESGAIVDAADAVLCVEE